MNKTQTAALPEPVSSCRVNYEGLHRPGAWCTVNMYTGPTGRMLLVLIDESDEHHNTSVTNRIERAAYKAFVAAGSPEEPLFAEHYRHSGQGLDMVTFDCYPVLNPCHCGSRDVGHQFGTPQWKHYPCVDMLLEANP